MISVNKDSVETLLNKIDVNALETAKSSLNEVAKVDFEKAYDWAADNFSNRDHEDWLKKYHKSVQALKDKQDLAMWRDGLTPLQRTARFLLGDDKRLPIWLGGEPNPVQAREDEAAALARVRSTFNGNTGITAHLDY